MVRKEGNIDVRGDYSSWSQLVEQELNSIGEDLRETAIRYVRKRGIDDRGDISKSIGAEVRRQINGWRLQFGAGAEHSIFVHEGTKPHWPPVEPIRGWVQRKLNIPVERVNKVTFFVRRKIAREGTPAKPFLAVAIRAHINTIAARIARQSVQ